MCDYSLHHVASRPATVGDKLVVTNFKGSLTTGFAAENDSNTAVCLLPGTEVAFAEPISHREPANMFASSIVTVKREETSVAVFCKVDEDDPNTHHDALQLPGGDTILLTLLIPEQRATVLQLPAKPIEAKAEAVEEDLFA